MIPMPPTSSETLAIARSAAVIADVSVPDGARRFVAEGARVLIADVQDQGGILACEHFGDLVFEANIPRTTRLAEAPSFGQPIIYYDPFSAGAEDYRRLAEEVCEAHQAPLLPSPVSLF